MSRSFERYNALRLTVAFGALLWATFSALAETEVVAIARVIGFGLLLLVLVLVGVRGRVVSRPFELFQLALDALLVSVLAEMTGALHSFFTLLYFPVIGAGAYLQRQRGALWAATFVTVSFAGMLMAHAGFQPPRPEDLNAVWSEAMFRIFAFYLMALLLGQLGEQLATTGRQLRDEQASSRILATEHDTVLDRVRAAVMTTSPDQRIVTLNPFGRQLLGDIEGSALSEVLQPVGETWEERRPDGRRWVCSRGVLPDGGSVIVVEDVTELSRMREAAASAERLAAAGRIAAGMAHEIRNPLASMSGSLQLIREEHPSELIDIALAESERLNRLVEDFLDMTRRPVLAPRMTDLRALCADICAAFSRDPRFLSTVRASAHGEARAVVVDPDRMRQAVWNLVLNGAQAMPRGGEVTLTLQESEGGVELLVADEGVGVPEADRARIFDPFYTTRSGGTGLGLALVAQIVRGHGGKVELRARTSGTGTEVCMWLPREATFDA